MVFNDIRDNKNRGFSLVELIVVVAIMSIMTAVLAPSLLQYVESSRAQKDDSAMGEVVEVVKLALADQNVYDECLCYTVEGNKSTYVIGEDEEPWELDGSMRGMTVTFHADKNANATKFELSRGAVNEYVDDGVTSFNGTDPRSTLSAMTSGNSSGELFSKVKAGVPNGEVHLTSQTYRNSDYTVFIKMGESDDPVVVYGQWGGTNLMAKNEENDENDEKEAVSNLYNGVELPLLPNDVDYGIYKFASIGMVNGVYMLQLASETPQYEHYSGHLISNTTGEVTSFSGDTLVWSNAASNNLKTKTYILDGGKWVLYGELDNSQANRDKVIFTSKTGKAPESYLWSNVDIQNKDSSLFLGGTDPDPVYATQ